MLTLNDLVVELRNKLRAAALAGEPESWPVTIDKSDLRRLLDAHDEHDEEMSSLQNHVHALGDL